MFRDSFKAYNMDNSFSDLMPVYGRGLLNTMVFEKKENAKEKASRGSSQL